MLGSHLNDSHAALNESESSEDDYVIEEVKEDEDIEEEPSDEDPPETDEKNEFPSIPPQLKNSNFLDMNKTADDDNVILSETRYCTVCNIEQPIRAKHCKECGKCV